MPPKADLKKTWKDLITAEDEKGKTEKTTTEKTTTETKNLESLLNVTPTLDIAKELFETNENAWNALIVI